VGRRRTDEGDFGAGSSFLVSIIARPRQARAGPGRLRALVAESDSGFGAAWIGLYRGLSCECEQPHFKFAKWLPTLGGTKATVRWTKGWWVAPK